MLGKSGASEDRERGWIRMKLRVLCISGLSKRKRISQERSVLVL